jgi:hypothetical protein
VLATWRQWIDEFIILLVSFLVRAAGRIGGTSRRGRLDAKKRHQKRQECTRYAHDHVTPQHNLKVDCLAENLKAGALRRRPRL